MHSLSLDLFLEARARFAVAAVAAALALVGCAEPKPMMPDASSIPVGPNGAMPPDCNALTERSVLTDGGFRQPSMQWGCATYTNLAAQVANPQDLVAPASLGPADAAVAGAAVHRYETGTVKSLDRATSLNATKAAPGGSGGGSP
ncbi:CpaD family pilus assembly lipoprotein [Burkholderia sp. 22PA0106]|uniref:CpaD family pilus assembly lipoprotein n=1 Tax=Burkholderia sp. 22PA0106 TaxID=3237371 RepID=UPI0039C128C8